MSEGATDFGPPYWQEGDFSSVNGYPRYSPDELDRRDRWLGDTMVDRGLDAIVIGGVTSPLEAAVQFFSNWPPLAHSYLLAFADGSRALLVRLWNHLPDAELIAATEDIRYGGDTPAEQAEAVAAELARRGCRQVGLIGTIPHGDLASLQGRLAGAELMDLNADYQSFRLVKTDEEMAFTRIGSRMNDAAVAAMVESIKPGMREYEIARIIEDVYLAHRGVNLIHFTLSTSMADPDRNVPHQNHPDRVIESGDVVVTEISTTFWGYSGQILRSFAVGEEPTPLYQSLHDVAEAAYRSIVDRLRPGVTIGEILDAANVIDEAGFGIWDDLVHGFGGGYLPPIIRTRQSRGATHADDFALPDGSLIVVQPNVISGSAGVQVGNSIQITAEGAEATQHHPMGFLRCG